MQDEKTLLAPFSFNSLKKHKNYCRFYKISRDSKIFNKKKAKSKKTLRYVSR